MRSLLLIQIFTLSLLIGNAQNKTGEDVIRDMYQMYHGKWLTNLTFEQYAYHYENDSLTKTEVWQEAYQYPNKLIIHFDGFHTGKGLIFVNDSVFSIQKGIVAKAKPRIHDLILLSLDVYNQDPSVTIRKAKKCGYDLSKCYLTTIDSTEVYVIGALEGDSTSNQFWIEKERLLFLKMIKNTPRGEQTVIFDKYEKYGESWIEELVLFYYNDVLIMREEYFNIEIPEELDPNIFNPINFSLLKW